MLNKITVLALVLVLSLLYCNDNRYISESKVKSLYKNSKNLNDTAAFLAGIPVDGDSSLHPITRNVQYKTYGADIDRIWEQYRRHNLEKIETWRMKNIKITGSGTVLYPFSGPDILNALAFFPQADEYVMIGLEQPGNVPDPLHYQGPNVYNELLKIKKSLRTILQLNLFRTIEMMADFRIDSYSNITGIMMFFLARYGYEILDIKKIHINLSGAIAYGVPRLTELTTVGVEFIFRKGKGSPIQAARFFSADLSDASLSQLRGFSSFLSSKKKFITLVKSASYLLSYDNFKIMRTYLLAGSRYILQEDSGIPYRYFSKNDWKFSYFGTYRVIAMFSNRFQRDLDAEMKNKSAEPLPFSFGYGFIPEKSNLMIAEKAFRSAN